MLGIGLSLAQVARLRVPFAAPPTLRIAFAGSSTYQGYGNDGSAATVPTATRSTDGVTFSAMGTTGAGLLTFAKIIADRTNLPARYLMRGRGGTTVLNDWLPAGSGDRKALVDGIKAMGGCDLLEWACGFNDALQNIVTDEATHLANLRQLFALIRQETGLPSLKIAVGVAQLYTGTGTAGPDAAWTALRSAEMKAGQDPNCFFSTHWFDLPQGGDGIHLTGAAVLTHAARVAENALAALGLGGAVLETGPRITAAEAVYTTKTRVTLAHSTGTDFTPATGITGLQVSFDNGQTMVSPTAIARATATAIELTHAASGGAAPTVYAYAGKAPNVSGVVRDNSLRALPLNPTYVGGVKAPAGTTVVDPATPAPAPTPTPAASRTAKVAFSKSNPAPSGFNAFPDSGLMTANANAGLSKALTDTTGAATGWTLTTATAFNNGNDTQGTVTGSNTGVYPDAAMVGYWYNGGSVNGDNGGQATTSTTLNLTGLNPARRYAFKVFGSRSAADRKTVYTAGGTSQTVDAGQNTTLTASFTNLVPDANGLLTLAFAPASGYSFGYLNVLEITETTPAEPQAYRVNYLDDQGASAGLWYGASANPAFVYDAPTNRVLGVVQRFNWNGGNGPLKENTILIYDMATRTATIGGVIMTDDGTIVGSADQHGVGTLCRDQYGFWHSYGGGHNQPMKHSVSVDGGLTWTASGTLGTSLTYSHPVQIGNVQYMIARKAPGGQTYPLIYYRSNSIDSATGAISWSGELPLIDLQTDTRVYAGTVVQRGADIYIPFTRATADDGVRRDLYLAVLDTTTGAVRNLSGSVVIAAGSLPVTRAQADASFRLVDQTTGGTEESNSPALWIDDEGAHFLYQAGAGGLAVTYARYSLAGALLEGPTAVGTASHRYATPMIGPRPGGGVEVLFPTNDGAPNDMETQAAFTRGGNVYRVGRPAGSTWSARSLVMACSPVHPLDSVTRVEGAPADFRFAFAERAIDDANFDTGSNLRTYGWGTSGMVTTPIVRDTDAAAFVAGAGYTDDDFEPVNAYFRAIKASGWWQRGDRAYLMAEPVEAVARKDVFGKTALTDTAAGNTHVPRSGLKPSASSKFTTAFNPSTATDKRLALTAINLCIVPYEDTQSASSDLGTTAATATLTLGNRSTSNNASTLLADSTSLVRAVTTSRFMLMSQRAGTRKEMYIRGKGLLQAATTTATALPNGDLTLGGNGTGFSQRGLAYAHIGQSIDAGPVMQAIKRYVFQRAGIS